ncbi:MAG: HNH endonuclease family protein [Kordiimonas sp.]
MTAGSRTELLIRPPLRRKKYARKYDPRPRMVEAYLFFFEKLKAFFLGDGDGEPLAAEFSIRDRIDECIKALRNGLMIVVIDLDQGDDPQVIFETLNARGEPLLPADLLRNYVFFRANNEGINVEDAYEKYWSKFDDEFWREEVKQGRLVRPRSDLYMQHFLASQQGRDIPIKHLYVEYRHWIERHAPFENITEELATLSRQGEHFRRIIEPEDDDVIWRLSKFLSDFDIRTAYPLLLALLDEDVDDEEWCEISDILESYLVRRAVCDLGTKNYNRIFLGLTRVIRKEGASAEVIRRNLLSFQGESTVWPDDASFRKSWISEPLYRSLGNAKLVHLFKRINQTYMSVKSDPVSFTEQPSVEHIMPVFWEEYWPLPNGEKGISVEDRDSFTPENSRLIASLHRDEIVNTLGNLTIISTSLNSAQKHYAWKRKKEEIKDHCLLPINQSLFQKEIWDEEAIEERANEHLERAVKVWSKPKTG